MSSALLQGVPATTFDTDLWLDLPERRYMLPINLALRQGATMIRQTVVVLRDGALLNFLYRVDGLASFGTEWRRAVKIEWCDGAARIISLERIIKSKEFIRRDKDLAILPLLRRVLIARSKGRIRR